MDLKQAELLGNKLMDKHGLLAKGWTLKFDNAKRRFGRCSYSKKLISLSSDLVKLNDEARVTNTILHEIAHALVGVGCGHGAIWKQVAINIGCDGNRCYSSDKVVTPKAKYEAVCGTCNRTHKKHRKPKRKTSCGYCSKTYNENYLLNYIAQ